MPAVVRDVFEVEKLPSLIIYVSLVTLKWGWPETHYGILYSPTYIGIQDHLISCLLVISSPKILQSSPLQTIAERKCFSNVRLMSTVELYKNLPLTPFMGSKISQKIL